MTTVYVALYDHRFGYDIVVYATEELAEAARQGVAREAWPDVMEDEPMSDDPREAADIYFEVAGNLGHKSESFYISERQVMGAEDD